MAKARDEVATTHQAGGEQSEERQTRTTGGDTKGIS